MFIQKHNLQELFKDSGHAWATTLTMPVSMVPTFIKSVEGTSYEKLSIEYLGDGPCMKCMGASNIDCEVCKNTNKDPKMKTLGVAVKDQTTKKQIDRIFKKKKITWVKLGEQEPPSQIVLVKR